MKSLRNFISKYKVGFTALALVAVGFAFSASHALAACPAVPADCTVDDVIGDSVDVIQTTVLSTLTTNLPVIIGVAVVIMVGFALVKLAIRWTRKFIH